MKAGERAFTLIEMLVVVGLIAILAALLAPSLRNAMEAARALRCLNGHRAIGRRHAGVKQIHRVHALLKRLR